MMCARRLLQLQVSGDRDDIVAIDGNAKMYRRTCGMPFAEVIEVPELGKRLLRGCSNRPDGKGTLCAKHKHLVGASSSPLCGDVREHRLRRALHGSNDVNHLEVKVGSCNRWQPACTADQAKLAEYFATRADARIQHRRLRRKLHRAAGVRGKRQRKEISFMAAWSSIGPRSESDCSTHKESDAQITAAARTAGFLTAVSESGIVIDVGEPVDGINPAP